MTSGEDADDDRAKPRPPFGISASMTGGVPRAASSRVLVAALLGRLFAPAAHAESDAPVGILVLKEHGTGSQALAQPYLDRFVALAAAQNGWSRAKGQYYTSRSAAEGFIAAEKPHYGILSLAAFLAFRDRYHLDVIGQVAVSLAGGRQYALISRSAADLAGCKGKTLASDHTDDARFLERVVAGGDFRLADFTLLKTQRPLQTIRKLLAGEAACALVDDAQLADLSHLAGADGVRPVWRSAELPPMAVVAFPTAPAGERARFQKNLARVCDDEGSSVCGEVGIDSLTGGDDTDYATVTRLYGP